MSSDKKKLLVGVVGPSGAGKDQVASFLVSNHHFTRIAFADSLKRAVGQVFGFTDEQLWGSERNTPDPRYMKADNTPLTPRFALQWIGTEGIRHCCPDIWVRNALRDADLVLGGAAYTASQGVEIDIYEDQQVSGVVISDVRFKNECEAIRAAGGILVKLLRGTTLNANTGHASESELQDIPDSHFDYIIDNRYTTLLELETQVSALYYKQRDLNT